MKVAGRRYVVMNHSDGIAHIMRNPHKALCSKENALLIEAVGGVTPKNLEYDLFESLGSAFSRISSNRNIPRFSASFHQHLLLAFDLFASPKPRINLISLNHFVGHCLYSSVSTALWGPDFPADTYPDFHVVDANLSRLLVPLPFLTPKHVLRAREALKARLGEYLRKRSRVKDDKEHATYEGSLLVDLILNADIPPPDQQGTLLGAMFALHSNSIRMSTWLLAYLLCDRALWCRLQQEVDSAISNHLDSKLENLLALPPTRFDQELFPLLDSALKEAIRLSTAPTLIRKVTSDCEVIIDGNNSVEVRTGEYVLTNGCAINFDEEFFHDAAHFQADRFVKGNSTTKPISAFGGGARMVSPSYIQYRSNNISYHEKVQRPGLCVIRDEGLHRPLPKASRVSGRET